jgi:hypothetical protein
MTCRPDPRTFRGTSQVFLPLYRIIPLYDRVPSEKQVEGKAVNRTATGGLPAWFSEGKAV